MPYLIIADSMPTNGVAPLFYMAVPDFDTMTGIPAILSAISNLPKEDKQKRVRSDKGKKRKPITTLEGAINAANAESRKKVEATL